ncbi:hypothetical protein GQ44DRAFT_812248 [Phaeosphaeriaceae sp. PMI808]|nr:hypothetical protein GQ44DRAFT_812248 [Phaeosphaeriaceae sp. PMI808]
MSVPSNPTPPYASKADFLVEGLEEVILEEGIDCPICRETLAMSRASREMIVAQSLDSASSVPAHTPDPASSVPTQTATTDDEPTPEIPVCIVHCGHIFGAECLSTWFIMSASNRCPQCTQVLFPRPRQHLVVYEPTRVMRLQFARMVEIVLDEPETAKFIRERLMSDLTRNLMLELQLEIFRGHGYEVTVEYVEPEDDEEYDADEYEEDGEEEDGEEEDGEEEDGEEEDGEEEDGEEEDGEEEDGEEEDGEEEDGEEEDGEEEDGEEEDGEEEDGEEEDGEEEDGEEEDGEEEDGEEEDGEEEDGEEEDGEEDDNKDDVED